MPSDSMRSRSPIERVLLERRDDEQHQVGAVRAGLVHLVGAEHEVLAQHRNLHCGAHCVQVVERAAEAPLLGQHADHPRATGLVFAGQPRRVVDRGERALRRAAALDLGDDADAGRAQRRERVGRRTPRQRRRPSPAPSAPRPRGRRRPHARRRRSRPGRWAPLPSRRTAPGAPSCERIDATGSPLRRGHRSGRRRGRGRSTARRRAGCGGEDSAGAAVVTRRQSGPACGRALRRGAPATATSRPPPADSHGQSGCTVTCGMTEASTPTPGASRHPARVPDPRRVPAGRRATATPARDRAARKHRADQPAGQPTGGEHRHDSGQRDQRQRRRGRVDRPSGQPEHVVGERPLACQNRGSASARVAISSTAGAADHGQQQRSRERCAFAHPASPARPGASVSAVAIACSTARALLRVSCSSSAGMLSATTPAPACT